MILIHVPTSIYTPVCLPSASDRFYGFDTLTIGWGVNTSILNNDEDADFAEVLQVCYTKGICQNKTKYLKLCLSYKELTRKKVMRELN